MECLEQPLITMKSSCCSVNTGNFTRSALWMQWMITLVFFFFFHDIWLTLPHGNAIFSCFCPSLLLIFHTDGPLLLYHPDQSLNIMRRLDSEII